MKKASKEYLDNLKPNDEIYVSVRSFGFYEGERTLRAVFVRHTPTKRLSFMIGKEKIWVNANGSRSVSVGNWPYKSYAILESEIK